MKAKKLIRYRLGVSRQFPATHPRKGDPTFFPEMILSALGKHELLTATCFQKPPCKLHTCRSNYPLWQKRFEKIEKGEAVLEPFYWSGKPYRSKQIVFATLSKDDGIGIQQLEFLNGNISDPVVWDYINFSDAPYVGLESLSKNDGLSLEDFKAWFKNNDLSRPMAIIHFTSFRY